MHEKRGYNGDMAKKLMKKIILENDFIIYSDIIIFELKRLGFSENEVKQILSIPKKGFTKIVYSTKQQIEEATKLSKKRYLPVRDAMHAILSRDNEAQLISRDWDFDKLKDITKAKIPEDIIS